jgi:N-acetylmuramoyl-L-alanine amidase
MRPGLVLAVSILVLLAQSQGAAARHHGRHRDAKTITAIVIHSIGGPACIAHKVQYRPIRFREDDAEFWRRILAAAPSADAHYVIGRTGQLAEVMPTTEIAYHTVGVNDVSIGIELVNRGDGQDPYPEAQIIRLIDLIKTLRQRYPAIPIENIVTHGDIDQRTCLCAHKTYRRRVDPGVNFPIQRVLKEVRQPGDVGQHPTSLPHLVGPAPARACSTASR